MRFPPYLFDAAALAAAYLLALLRPSPAWIERYYANGAYPLIDRAIRGATGPVPICVGDVLLAFALIGGGVYWYSMLARGRGRGGRTARAALRTLAVLAVIFVWFEVAWALDYSRIPLADKIIVHERRTDARSVDALADRVVDELSKAARPAHREHHHAGDFVPALEPSFQATIRRLGDVAAYAPPRVKPTVLQPFFTMSGTSGFTDPWTHEVNVDARAFFYERPMYYAHEWAHIAGFTDEAEANFISALACTRSHDPLAIYSGWMLVWFNLPQNVHVSHRMTRLAYNDIMAVRARYLAHVNRNVAAASRTAYDRYLKSNHVEAGFASYGLFIRWMTGADFDASGLPKVKPTPR
ncbi:MAG: DUF3810 family protein [Candidatus Eremiobacteraeota bacterium]|nr:DUF3810 family protein [Candidatus Eremiobacteraeota bacterium]MBC5820575.1 DUF3810 family protein [Candidatus Eremiobacteraeota bacterium]